MLQLDFIRAKCASTAAWRNSLIARYPHDSARNTTARDLLRTIAVMPNDAVSSVTRERLSQYNVDLLVKAAEESCRMVGFKFLPLTLDDVVWDVIARLDVLEAEIATRREASLAAVLPQGGA